MALGEYVVERLNGGASTRRAIAKEPKSRFSSSRPSPDEASGCATNSSASSSSSSTSTTISADPSLELASSSNIAAAPLTILHHDDGGGSSFIVNNADDTSDQRGVKHSFSTASASSTTQPIPPDETRRLTKSAIPTTAQKTIGSRGRKRSSPSSTTITRSPRTVFTSKPSAAWTTRIVRRLFDNRRRTSADGRKRCWAFSCCCCCSTDGSSDCWRTTRTLTIGRLMAIGLGVSFLLVISAYLIGRFLTTSGADCPASSEYLGSNGGNNKSYRDYAYALLRDQLVDTKRLKPTDGRHSPVVRLDRRVIPTHYDLHLDLTELPKRTIRGTVRIVVDCLVTTDSFVLHASHEHLTIQKVSMTRLDKRRSLGNISWHRTNQSLGGDSFSTVRISFTESKLIAGHKYELAVVYTATVCTGRSGVNCYEEDRANGHGQSGSVATYISTKFEPTAARTLLPCFDEPDLKAAFNVTVVRHSDMVVIANSPPWKRVRTRHAQVIEHFESTPPMSTYLLGLIVGPYVRQEKRTERGTRVAVWTRREDRSKGEYALDYSSRMLRSMEHYFAINYHLPKLDLVASPNYPVGAMENWGLLIFHQRALLYVDEYRLIGNGGGSSSENGHQVYQPHLLPKFHTSKIIIHELLHQWFGNLATMHWWSEIWLNEGFATFFIYQFLKDDFPQMVEFHQTWKVVDAWQRQTAAALWFDPHHERFRPENYTLVRNFTSDEEIYEAFDEYHLYAKGGAVVRMLWHLLGENSMRSGLIRYLSANSFRSVDRWELWKYLEYSMPSGGGKGGGLGEMIESWLTNPGFPEVKVTRNGAGSFHLEQNMADVRLHCAYYATEPLLNESRRWVWSIPLSYTMDENPLGPNNHEAMQGEPFWMTNRTHTFTDAGLTSASQWLLVNPDFQFPYRVNYDLDNWALLTRQLRTRPDRIPLKSRVQLLVDGSFFLKETDDLPHFLDLLGYLRWETDLLPMILGLREVYSILDQYKASSIYPLLVFYFRPVVEQASKLRAQSEREPELDAVWWMDDSFSLTLKLLQCITRHRQCHISREEVQSVLSLPSSGQITDKLIPICEFLRRNFSKTEREILIYWLDQQRSQLRGGSPGTSSGTWRQDIVFMVACVHDGALIKKLIDVALARGDLELLATALSSTFTLNHNDLLTVELWSRLGNASVGVRSSTIEPHLQNMLRSVRTVGELELARRSLASIGFDHLDEISFIEARLTWQERRLPSVEDWLMEKLELKGR